MEQSKYICTQFKKFKQFSKTYFAINKTLPSSTYRFFNNKGIKHITSLRIESSHFRDHKFKHGILDSLDPLIIYSIAPVLQMKDQFF